MNKRIWTVLALAVFAATAAHAEGANFVSGNKNNDGHYTPRKVYNPKDPNREPGFWDKEWKRSGLDRTAGKMKVGNPIKGMQNFFKDKEEAYKARNAGSDSAVK